MAPDLSMNATEPRSPRVAAWAFQVLGLHHPALHGSFARLEPRCQADQLVKPSHVEIMLVNVVERWL